MITTHKEWLAAVGEIALLVECEDLTDAEEIYLDDLIADATRYQKKYFPGGKEKDDE